MHMLGADLRDGTPIFDIKPYIPFADCHPDATGAADFASFCSTAHERSQSIIAPPYDALDKTSAIASAGILKPSVSRGLELSSSWPIRSRSPESRQVCRLRSSKALP